MPPIPAVHLLFPRYNAPSQMGIFSHFKILLLGIGLTTVTALVPARALSAYRDSTIEKCSELLLSTTQLTERYREFSEEELRLAKMRTENVAKFLEEKLIILEQKLRHAKAERKATQSFWRGLNPFHSRTPDVEPDLKELEVLWRKMKDLDTQIGNWMKLPPEIRKSRIFGSRLENATHTTPPILASASILLNSDEDEVVRTYKAVYSESKHFPGDASAILVYAALFSGASSEDMAETLFMVLLSTRGTSTEIAALLTQVALIRNRPSAEIIAVYEQIDRNRLGDFFARAILAQTALYTDTAVPDILELYGQVKAAFPNVHQLAAANLIQLSLLTGTPLAEIIDKTRSLAGNNYKKYSYRINTILLATYFGRGSADDAVAAINEGPKYFNHSSNELATLHLFARREFVPEGKEREACLILSAFLLMVRHATE